MARRAALVVLAVAAAMAFAAAEVTVNELSTGFEGDRPPAGWSVAAAPKDAAAADLGSSAAVYSGSKGARINKKSKAANEMDVQLLSPGFPLVAGRTYKASLRLRSSKPLNASLQWAYHPSSFATGFRTALTAPRGDSPQTEFRRPDPCIRSHSRTAGGLQWAYHPSSFATGFRTPLAVPRGEYRLYAADDFTPSITTLYRLVLALGGAAADSSIDLDDVQVTVNAEVPELELIANASSSFEQGHDNPFILSVLSPAAATADFNATSNTANPNSKTAQSFGSMRAAEISVSAPGPETYSVQLLSRQVLFEPNHTYSAAVLLRSSVPGAPVVFSWNTGPPSYAYVKGSAASVAVQANYEDMMRDAKPLDRVYMAESFEGDNSSLVPVTKDGAAAMFDLKSTAAASEGKRGARVTVIKQPDDKGCDHCISLASSSFPDMVGTTYTLTFDLRSSQSEAPFHVNFHMQNESGAPLTDLEIKKFKASTSFRRYTTSFTSVKRNQVVTELNFGLAAPGVIFDVDNIVMTTDGGVNVPIAAASTGFEAGKEQPYVGLVNVQGVGRFDFASTANPYNGNRSAAVNVLQSIPQQPWALQMRSNPVSLVAGLTYTVTARMRSTQPSKVDFSWTSGAPEYLTISSTAESVEVGSVWDLYAFTSTVNVTGMYGVHFDFGKAPASAIVFVDDIIATCDW
ncbi:hypothetical protein OEZ85_005053 [Tetradesmus obliquus]|uniref:CBM-cenC domain-containing protein n=1 Tax=Tetradesmus obliquus TaxID=3088 RepID=A0ABY8UGN8_TETOB|nr:hypothetical protein OEZ85_005053 [Tetradesmus obliquus]